MFHVGRYDPTADKVAKKKKERAEKRQKRDRSGEPARKRQKEQKQHDKGTKRKTKKEHKRKSSMNKEKESEMDHHQGASLTTDLSKKEGNRRKHLAKDPSKQHHEKNSFKSVVEENRIDRSEVEIASTPLTKTEPHGQDASVSSSVPSSSESEDEGGSHTTMPMHVIAPEQKVDVVALPRAGKFDEAFDDFDIEDEPETGDVSEEIATALHMSSLPIHEAAAAWNLAPFLLKNLQRDGYEHFFPIQSLVIPDVIATDANAHIRARDVCVAAPTGSGKTLAFVLPVLNALSKRVVRRLRALVVLPSRDLATQVHKVFERYATGSDLKIGLAIGQSDFVAEQIALTVGKRNLFQPFDIGEARHRHSFCPTNLELAMDTFSEFSACEESFVPRGGRSAVDVLVATPGRLVDHLDRTAGFTLQHLRFLVIDEADRLLNQSYHNWIRRVISSTNSASVQAWKEIEESKASGVKFEMPPLKMAPDGSSFVIDPITWRRGGAYGDGPTAFTTNGYGSFSSVVASVCQPVQVRKMLYSATMTKDPQKLAALGLVNPIHFDAHHLTQESRGRSKKQYAMPPRLSEHTVECTAQQKPYVLLALLLERIERTTRGNSRIAAVFTSSLDSTHRLVRLLQLLWAANNFGPQEAVAEFSSALNQRQRSSLMKRCNDDNGSVSVVVCSDSMSRGMDIPSLSTVINYDVPGYAKTYVHRCGRTARAGREGTAISVLKTGQVSQFTRMRSLIESPDRVSPIGIKKELVRNVGNVYQSCLQTLRKVLGAEQDGELNPTSPIPSEWIPSSS